MSASQSTACLNDPATVEVWHLPLLPSIPETRLLPLLEAGEKRRVEAYRDADARRRFLLCRASLRLLLGARLHRSPDTLELKTNTHGKPQLADLASGLTFNVSHSDSSAVIALAEGIAVGVDVESWRPLAHGERIARRCFAPEELAWWLALPDAQRIPGFFSLWTRKEAFAKAVGRGIAIGLERISMTPSGTLTAVPPGCGNPEDWSLHDLGIGCRCSAAVAVQTPLCQITLRELDVSAVFGH